MTCTDCDYRDHGMGGCACPNPVHAGDPEHPFAPQRAGA